jgi:hypothetical protein
MKPLADRMYWHVKDYIDKRSSTCYSSRVFADAGGPEACDFNIIKEFPDCTRDELLGHESRFIVSRPCINHNISKRGTPLFRN